GSMPGSRIRISSPWELNIPKSSDRTDESATLQFSLDPGSKCSPGREEQLCWRVSLPAFLRQRCHCRCGRIVGLQFFGLPFGARAFQKLRRKGVHDYFFGGGEQECRQLLFCVSRQCPIGLEPRLRRPRRER